MQLYRVVTFNDGRTDRTLWDEQDLNEENHWYYEWTDLETAVATSADAKMEAASEADASYTEVSSASKAEKASASKASRSDADEELYDEDGHLKDGNIFDDLADGFGSMWKKVTSYIATIFGLVDESEVTVTWEVEEVQDETTQQSSGYMVYEMVPVGEELKIKDYYNITN